MGESGDSFDGAIVRGYSRSNESALIYRTIDGLNQVVSLVSNRDGPAAFETHYHHTAYVFITASFCPPSCRCPGRSDGPSPGGNVFAEPAQDILHQATDVINQRLVTFDIIMVGMNPDLHDVMLLHAGATIQNVHKKTAARAAPALSVPLPTPTGPMLCPCGQINRVFRQFF
jgi:hypothetical protein